MICLEVLMRDNFVTNLTVLCECECGRLVLFIIFNL